MKINLNNKSFRSQSNAANGEVSEDTIFNYFQEGLLISADYTGGSIKKGHLIGQIINDEYLEFVYHHVNLEGEIMTGKCKSYPQLTNEGKWTIKEYWQWTCKDYSKGESILTEI